MESKIRIGISSCLLGERVRYDGGDKRDEFITRVLGRYWEWVPVCPELEIGMGVPREPVRLVGPGAVPRMIASESGTDWTVRMLDWSGTRARGLGDLDLSGYILKSKSPSCGIDDVKIHSSHRSAGRRKRGGGIFATVFMNQHPLVPVADERRLSDPAVRENFIVRVFAYRRLQRLLRGRFTVRRLQEFHASEELLLMAHNPARCRTLGRLVASAGTLPASELKVRYAARFMRCLETPSTPANHALVLRKLAARLPRSRRVGQLLRQSYFSPYPEEFNFADPG